MIILVIEEINSFPESLNKKNLFTALELILLKKFYYNCNFVFFYSVETIYNREIRHFQYYSYLNKHKSVVLANYSTKGLI
jgi:hypothetical protein